MGDEELAYYIQLLVGQNNDPSENGLAQIFEQMTSNTNNHHTNMNNNIHSLNNLSLNNSVRPTNVPPNPTTINNPPSMTPTPTLSPPNNMAARVAMPPPQEPNRSYYYPSHMVHNPLDPNWEAIGAFLAGQVRIGPDLDRAFRCIVCNVEFANAQALGGHMSSHTKNRKAKEGGRAKSCRSTKTFKRMGRK